MPRYTKFSKVPDLSGISGNPNSLLVQKSNPLQSLSETKMTLAEFKILDAYLSRIDSHNPNARYVRFEKGELERLLGVTQIKKEDLSKRIDNLFQVITIRDANKPKKFTKIALFAKADCEQNENGQWQIDLACSAEAMEYVFNIDNIGYLRYRLKNVVDLTSRYSYILYLYLENNRFRKSWTISLGDLKDLLNCTADTYTEYKRFNDLILKKCHKEINQKTNVKYEYQSIKKGRKVAEICFTVETGYSLVESLPDQLSFDVEEIDWETVYGSEQLATLAEGCRYEFNKEQMEQISRMLVRINIPKDKMSGSVLFGKQFYLREKYAALNAEAAKKSQKGEKPIRNRFKYFLKMLEDDAFQPVAYTDKV